jgi:hypothetical protein
MSTSPEPRLRLSVLAFSLLLMMCFSYEAKGDPTAEEDLSPGIKLRIESCGYEKTFQIISDDDDSAGDDDDSGGDDDDSAGDDDDSGGDDDDSGGGS